MHRACRTGLLGEKSAVTLVSYEARVGRGNDGGSGKRGGFNSRPWWVILVGVILLPAVYLQRQPPHGGGGSAGDELPEVMRPVGGQYESYPVKWVPRGSNDGDSFMVELDSGSRQQVRLYFVDAPETSRRRYRDGNTNFKRISDQGRYFGGLSEEQTTQLGQRASEFVESLLSRQQARLYTVHESVFDSARIYGLLKVEWQGQQRWLHEILVEEGLVRIHTKPNHLPDNTSGVAQIARLKELEKKAKQKQKGGWGRAFD